MMHRIHFLMEMTEEMSSLGTAKVLASASDQTQQVSCGGVS